jgi:hypothetical protein
MPLEPTKHVNVARASNYSVCPLFLKRPKCRGKLAQSFDMAGGWGGGECESGSH